MVGSTGLGESPFCSWPWYQLTAHPHCRLSSAHAPMLLPSLLPSTYRSLLPNSVQPVRLSARGNLSIMTFWDQKNGNNHPKSSQNWSRLTIHLKATTEVVNLPLEMQEFLAVVTTYTKWSHKNEVVTYCCGANGLSQLGLTQAPVSQALLWPCTIRNICNNTPVTLWCSGAQGYTWLRRISAITRLDLPKIQL